MNKQKSNVWIFMLIAYGFSWLFWIPEALIAQNMWNAPEGVKNILALNLGAWGPLIGAIVTTFIYQKGAGVKALLKRGFMARLGKWWWIVLLTFPVLIGGSLAISALFGNPLPEFEALAQPFALPIALVFIFFLGGPLQEEFGWRGYAFENLRNRYDALTAAIIAGLMWGLWHLPLFFVPRAEDYYNRPMWGLLLTTVLAGIILAWFYANTKGSIFAALLGHTMFNWSNWVLPALKSDSAALILFGLYFLAVVYIVRQYGRKTLNSFEKTLMKTQKASSKNKRGCLFYIGMVLIVLLVIGGLTYRAGQKAKVELQAEFPAPGQLVDVGGYQMHIHCMGEGSPTVILEAGAGSFSTDWALIQPEVAKTNQVCVYDRAGYGWSERSPQPQSAAEITSALHTLLNNGGMEGPYIMVGHSLGGLYVRLFQQQYPGQVVGMVLVDSAHEEVRIRSSKEFRQAEDAFFSQFNQQVKTFQAINEIGLMALSPSQCPENEKLPADAQTAYCAVLAMDGRFFTTLQEEYELLDTRIEQVREASLGSLGDMPLIALEAGQFEWTGNDIESSVLDEHKQLTHTLHQELAELSSQGKLITVEESGHFIQIEQPSVVVNAIYQVIGSIR